MFKTKNFWYISLFVILYLITAGSSFFHAISFFGLANNSWMSIILAFAFEVGQAAVLFSLLTSKKDRSRFMPWVLMTMFTLVQVVGNVFSSYKHIILNSIEDLKYFKEPIFIWTNLPDQEATVIVTWAIGAILPIAALLLTSMITNYLSDQEELKFEQKPIKNEVENQDDKEKSIKELEDKPNNEVEKLKKELETERSLHQDISEEFPKVVEENGKKDEEIKQLKEDHDKVLDEKFETEKKLEDALEKTGDLNKSLVEKNNEIEKLKQELEELKHHKIVQIPVNEIIHNQPMEEPEIHEFDYNEVEKKSIEEQKELTNSEKKEITQEIHELNKENTKNENLEQVEDLIKNGIKEDKKDSHFINI